jgi:hypothetical protein
MGLSVARETAGAHIAETKSIAGEAEGFDHIIARPLLQVTKARRMIVGNFSFDAPLSPSQPTGYAAAIADDVPAAAGGRRRLASMPS